MYMYNIKIRSEALQYDSASVYDPAVVIVSIQCLLGAPITQ